MFKENFLSPVRNIIFVLSSWIISLIQFTPLYYRRVYGVDWRMRFQLKAKVTMKSTLTSRQSFCMCFNIPYDPCGVHLWSMALSVWYHSYTVHQVFFVSLFTQTVLNSLCTWSQPKGAWMEFATDINNAMYAYIDRKKKFPVTYIAMFIGFETDKDIPNCSVRYGSVCCRQKIITKTNRQKLEPAYGYYAGWRLCGWGHRRGCGLSSVTRSLWTWHWL